MAKCRICGKSGLFVKVNEDGVCRDCEALSLREKYAKNLDAQIANKETLIQKIKLDARHEAEAALSDKLSALKQAKNDYAEEYARLEALDAKIEKSQKSYESQSKRVSKLRDLYKAMEYSIAKYRENPTADPDVVKIDDINKPRCNALIIRTCVKNSKIRKRPLMLWQKNINHAIQQNRLRRCIS